MAHPIAKSIALPGRTAPMRYPSFPALERTALMGFNASIAVKLNAGNSRYMLVRQAAYPLWGDTKASGETDTVLTWGVTYSGTSFTPATVTSQLSTMYTETVDQIGAWHQSTSYGVNNPNRLVPGGNWPTTYPVLGVDRQLGEIPWVFVPNGAYTLVSVAATTFAYTASIQLEAWSNPGQSAPVTSSSLILTAPANTSAGAAFKINGNGWYRVKGVVFSDTAGNPVNSGPTYALGAALSDVIPTYTPSTSFGTWNMSSLADVKYYFLPLTVSPEFANSPLPWMATRLNAVAALFTNTTKVLNKEGTVLWGRTNPNLVNPFNVNYTTVQNLHPAEKAFLDLEHGTYAYNPPSTDLAEFYNYSIFANPLGGNNQVLPVYRLDNTAFTAQAFFNDADGDTSLAINLDYHFEFRTSSTLFQIGVATTPLETLHMAQVALLRAGFFFNNFDHTALIGKIIKFVGSMHPLLAMAAPVMNGMIGASSYALTNRPTQVNRPSATSGQGAGIVSAPKRRAPARPRKARVQRRPRQPRPASKPVTRPARGKNGMQGGLDMYLAQKR